MIPKRCKECKHLCDPLHWCWLYKTVELEEAVKNCDAKAEAEQDLREKIIVNFGGEE